MLALKLRSQAFIYGCLVFLLVSCTTVKSHDEAILHLRIGTAWLQQGRYPNALRELLEAEKLDPKNPVVQNNLGLAYFLREKYELAVQHLERAVEIDSKYSEARNNLGRVLIEQGKYNQAITELKIVIADLLYPTPGKAYVNLGLARFRQGQFEEAKEDFAKAIKLDREDCLAQNFYGRSLFELNQFTEAAPALDHAVIVCKASKLEEPQYFSGLTYYKLGRTSDAISRMEGVVSEYPSSRYAKKAESLLQIMK